MADDVTRLQALAIAAMQKLDPEKPGWDQEMQRIVARSHTAAYMVGIHQNTGVLPKGLSRAERADLTRAVNEQLGYLAKFSGARGGLSKAQISARAALYAGPLKATTTQARYGGWDIPRELIPASGSTRCLGHCLCEIDIEDNGDGTGTLTRTLNDGKPCPDCESLAGEHEIRRKDG